jgi:hypothetical protein
MKILVMDDCPNNRYSAEVCLADHDLTIVGSYDEAQKAMTTHPDFDLVLFDLMMPAPSVFVEEHGDQEMPLGTFLVLFAINAGFKNIGLLTDMSHHEHAASACLDPFLRGVIQVGDVRIRATNNCYRYFFDVETKEMVDPRYLQGDENDKYKEDEEGEFEGIFRGKDWDRVFRVFLDNEEF